MDHNSNPQHRSSPASRLRQGKRWAGTGVQTLFRPILKATLLGWGVQSPRFNERSVEYAFVFKHLSQLRPGKLLDVGPGYSAFPALASLAGWDVTAVDNVRDFWPSRRLGLRLGMFNPHFYVHELSMADSFFDGEFDVVSCVSTFEHVSDRAAVFKAMAKALVPGGILLLTGPFCETGGCVNVYERPDSDAFLEQPPYPCRVMDAGELAELLSLTSLQEVDSQWWRFYTGLFWSEGNQISPPVETSRDAPHQIACFAFMKRTEAGKAAP